MSRRFAGLTLDTARDLAPDCRTCTFWELDPTADAARIDPEAAAAAKAAWISATLLEWGGCGLVLYVEGEPAGHAMYAPPAYVPRNGGFATSPVAADAVLLMSARIRPELRGRGLGRVLMQGVARDVVRRGIRAIEAFGRHPLTPSSAGCLLPAGYLLSVGFTTVRTHPLTPRLRLDIRSTVTWREDVESAIERFLGAIPAPLPRPVPTARTRISEPPRSA